VFFGLFRRRKSKDQLRKRLELVLSYDRARLAPGKMEELKRELLAVVDKYFPSDGDDLNVRFEHHGDRMVLVADLPRREAR
jgi:cell division topological specificity factor